MTIVYFVRHAQPDHDHEDDMTRPLTEEGWEDTALVLDTLKDKEIDIFYCSPYLRSMCTIQSTADFYGMEIHTDMRLREREKGPGGNVKGLLQKRWEDFTFCEEGGESIAQTQKRNIEVLQEILAANTGKNIVIGTHGTALSSIMNYYRPEFNCDDFLRIVDWMPYIVELDFEGNELVGVVEHAYREKEYKAKSGRSYK